MSEAPQINVHLTDERTLNPLEIAWEREHCKTILDEAGWTHKPLYHVMNRAYLKELEAGETKKSAEQGAAHAAGRLGGILIGALFTLLFVGFLGWVYDLAKVASAINTVIAIFVWICLFALGFRRVHRPIFKRIASAFRWVKARFKRKESAS